MHILKSLKSCLMILSVVLLFKLSLNSKHHYIRFTEANILGTHIYLPKLSLAPLSEEGLLEKSFQKDPAASLSGFMLAESTLNAIRQNYVDKDRITPSRLIDYLVSGNEIFQKVKLKREPGKLTITSKTDTLTLPIPNTLNFSHVRNILVTLASFIDEQISKNPDQNASPTEKLKSRTKGTKTIKGINIALNMMLTSLDAHSAFLDKDDYKDLRQGTEGSFGGLGIVVGMKNQVLTVLKPIPNSPAVKAGIHSSDTIVTIDSLDTFGTPLDNLVTNMRGAPGSVVNLSILKENALSPVSLRLARDIILVESVESKKVTYNNQNFLVLKIENFAARTSQEMVKAMEDFRKDNLGQIPGMILDLRSNPGGLLDQAIKVVDHFVKSGVIVSTRGRRTEAERATTKVIPSFPLIVLVDNDSASASEIVAGALQDHKRALVVGQPSFGKASVQTIFEVPDDQALKLTIARYYTPNNRSIQNTGITPDIWLQPVNRVASNENPLGPWRYRSERYLRSTLDLGDIQTDSGYDPAFKGYYLKNEDPKELFAQDQKKDFELDFSIELLSEYAKAKQSGEFNTDVALRGLKDPISSQIAKMTKEVQGYIDTKLKIHWLDLDNQTTHPAYNKDSGLVLSFAPAKKMTFVAGEKVAIPFTIKNLSNESKDEMTLFARSDKFGFPTDEILIPELPPRATHQGSIPVKIPNYWSEETLPLALVLAQGGTPIFASTQNLKLETKSKSFPVLTANSTFVEVSGGKLPGKLEPGERAKFRVTVTNDSKSTIDELEVKLINLAGTQIKVDGEKKILKKLAAGQKRDIELTLSGTGHPLTETLKVGLSIESQDLLTPYQKLLTITGATGS